MSATEELIAAALRLAALAERNTDDRDEWQHAIDSVREACARAMVQPDIAEVERLVDEFGRESEKMTAVSVFDSSNGYPDEARAALLDAVRAIDAERDEWQKLRDPATLHANLLRGEPARLTREMLLHLLGDSAPQPVSTTEVAMPEHVEQLAITRYRPVPNGMFGYKVVAGDGARSVFEGTKSECTLIARKLTEAFLDGAHAAIDAAQKGGKG